MAKLAINEDTSTFKTLSKLITLRNRILHNKEFLKEIDFPSLVDNVHNDSVEYELAMEPNYIETLNRDLCIKFGTALGDFKKQLMDPALSNDLAENVLLLQV